MINNITNILGEFHPISLHEMDSVALLDRTDTKYVFHINDFPGFLSEISEFYRVLEINNKRISDYESLYFDTKDFKLYTLHHNGKANRYKFRYRRYMDSDTCYFEIKFKSNKARTIKTRFKCDGIKNTLNEKAEEIVNDKFTLSLQDFDPVVSIYYTRITLVSVRSKERLTIDIGLNFKNIAMDISIPSLVIAEVKRERNSNSFFAHLMKERRIQPISISKYCLGIINLYENPKRNNFKENLIRLKKICYV